MIQDNFSNMKKIDFMSLLYLNDKVWNILIDQFSYSYHWKDFATLWENKIFLNY